MSLCRHSDKAHGAIVARRGVLFMSEPVGSGGKTDGERIMSVGGARHLLRPSVVDRKWTLDSGSGSAVQKSTLIFDLGPNGCYKMRC